MGEQELDYKEEIIKIVDSIESKKVLRFIYTFIKGIIEN